MRKRFSEQEDKCLVLLDLTRGSHHHQPIEEDINIEAYLRQVERMVRDIRPLPTMLLRMRFVAA